jgi:hypothetical protein
MSRLPCRSRSRTRYGEERGGLDTFISGGVCCPVFLSFCLVCRCCFGSFMVPCDVVAPCWYGTAGVEEGKE